jgi:hypothetical protein
MELWDDSVIVHVHCPTAMEAAALSGILLEDNAGTCYSDSLAAVRTCWSASFACPIPPALLAVPPSDAQAGASADSSALN